jgi:hypothetical protein
MKKRSSEGEIRDFRCGGGSGVAGGGGGGDETGNRGGGGGVVEEVGSDELERGTTGIGT